ncbi:hypothetical protein M9Y10_037866 [Tritrichomonas musculus]|uniref:Uncharacterized protein n=1 Tax=Tritrichomonas musculus TaxID=1915356 RepID=A0ABR2K7P4_9EUKA
MNSKIALQENSDSNAKTTDPNHKHRRALQVLENQQHSSHSHQIKKPKPLQEKVMNENQASLASRLDSLKNFQHNFYNDMSSSSDDFDDENFRDIMNRFEHFNDSKASFDIPKPTTEDMDDIYVRNTMEAKQASDKKFPYDPFENDPEFGRVQ